MKKIPVSAVLVIHNEEKHLDRALRSCADIVDDIIIVHDGRCTDKSLEIARKYTDKIFIRPHYGSAQPHRPFTYENSRNDWILQLDADEYLSSKLKAKLSTLIQQKNDVFIFSWPTLNNKKLWYGRYKTALFKKNKVYLLGITHEYPKEINKGVRTKKVSLDLVHDPGYNDVSVRVFKKKWIKRAKRHAQFLKDDFRNIKKWNYSNNFWDYPTSLRVEHPVIVGMILSPLFHIVTGIKILIKDKSLYMLKFHFYTAVYFFIVFLYFQFDRKELEI